MCVTDDETATTCRTAPIEITNAAPVLVAGAPITVSEGVATDLNSEFTDPGFDSDTIPSVEDFTATVDWGDGTTEPIGDVDLEEISGSSGVLTTGTIQASHAYGLYGTYLVTVCVTDDDHDTAAANVVDGQDCDTLSVEVVNAPPVVDAGDDRLSIEGIPFALNPTEFSDLGYVSGFTATVDWGDGTDEPAEEINIAVSDPEEGQVTTGIVEAVHNFADDGTYTIEVCVSDELNQVCDSFDATIFNVSPVLDEPAFLVPGISFPSGSDAFLGRKQVSQIHPAEASDFGSDDLRYDWTFTPNPDRFDGTLPPTPETETTTTFNDGSPAGAFPFTDPGPTDDLRNQGQGTFPFTSGDTATVTFAAPGVYIVDLLVTDDNGGTDTISLPKLVTDNFICARSHGYWKNQLRRRGDDDLKLIAESDLLAYLDLINFASSVFSEDTPAVTIQDALNVLWPNNNRVGDDDDDNAGRRDKALREAFAAWLNLARGNVLWDGLISVEFDDEDDDVRVTKPLHQWMAEVESILLDPASSRKDFERAKDIAEEINDSDDDTPSCDDDDDAAQINDLSPASGDDEDDDEGRENGGNRGRSDEDDRENDAGQGNSGGDDDDDEDEDEDEDED